MALIVLTSANGSPGVTTSALGLALAWPRPVILIDADPTASMSIPAGYLEGAEIPPNRSTVDLALSNRDGHLADDLPLLLLDLPGSEVKFLVGPSRHSQARMLTSMWGPLAEVLHELSGQDVIVDAGRLGLEHSPAPLIATADLCLLTLRATLPAAIAAHSWAASLRDTFESQGASDSLGLLIIDEPGKTYPASVMADALGIAATTTLPWDPATARLLSHGEKVPSQPWWKRWSSSLRPDLNRGLQAAEAAISAHLTTSQLGEAQQLQPDGRRQ